MRIFNEAKTKELFDPNLEKGYLYNDKLLVRHHEEIPQKVIKTVEEVRDELITKGEEVLQAPNGNWYHTLKHYAATQTRPEGRIGEEVKPVTEEAVPAWDEYENIQVYHPYTDEEYKEYLRAERERICFPVINRGAAWYARLTPEQNEELQAWYQAWLDAPETGIKPETPVWI